MKLRPYQELASDFIYERDCNVMKTVWKYENGQLYWRVKCGRGRDVKHAGGMVRTKPDSLGYCYVTFQRKHFAVHRVVFCLAYGYLPECVDHIDGNPSNNVHTNLRAATRLQNQHNRRVNKKTKSGIKNVAASRDKWEVRFSINRRTVRFGVFENLELAELVAQEVRLLLHKEFARDA